MDSCAGSFIGRGCTQAEVTPEPESSAAETDPSSEAGEDLPPEVTGAGRGWFFPAISQEDFDRWVTEGAPDAEKPDDGEITPLLETESCLDYLVQTFPEISDWRVLYEDDHYFLCPKMYDPYTYSWRDQWIPYRFVVLGTKQSDASTCGLRLFLSLRRKRRCRQNLSSEDSTVL